MADEKQKDAGRKDIDRKPKGEAAPAESTYTRAEHLRHATAMYGVPSHVVAGAFAVLDEGAEGIKREDQYTKSEIEAAVADFSARKITKEN